MSGEVKNFLASKAKYAKKLLSADAGRVWGILQSVWSIEQCMSPFAGNKKRDLSEKVLVGLKPFHVGLLISAQEKPCSLYV
jgi:hypothetical protein